MKKYAFIAASLSIFFHFFVFFMALYLFSSSPHPLIIGGKKKSLSPIAVDVVGLPKHTIQERKPSKTEKPSMKLTRKIDNRELENSLKKIKQQVEDKERRGNIKSEGYKGEEGESHWYLDHVHDVIDDNLTVPPHLLNEETKTTYFIIFIDNHGALKDLKMKESSGNEEFDTLAESAIYASNPFEPPPLDLRSLLKRGILIKIVSSEEVP